MRTGPALVAALVLLTLAGCTPFAEHVPKSPSASATPVFASDADALAAAEVAYAAYLKVSDEIAQDGGANPERIDSLATGSLKKQDLEGFKTLISKSWHSTGLSKIKKFDLEAVARTASKAAVTAHVCEDVSAVDVFDASGTSVVSAARPDLQSFEIVFDQRRGRLLPSSREAWTGSDLCA